MRTGQDDAIAAPLTALSAELRDDDVAKLRAESGVSARRAYLNHARISPYPRPTRDALRDAIDREYRQRWTRDLDADARTSARTALADLLGAALEEIAMVQSATYAANAILNGLPWEPGDNVVWTDLEYRAVAQGLFRLRDERGIELRLVRADGWRLDPDAIAAAVDGRTRLVVVPMVPTYCGVIQPVEEIGRRLAGASAVYAINATQAVGQLPVDVARLGCDALFGTSRKWLRGPRGLGFLFVRRSRVALFRPTTLGDPAARWTEAHAAEVTPTIDRFHAGDYPYPAVLGLAASARYARGVGPARIAVRNRALGSLCRGALSAERGVVVHDLGEGETGTVPFTVLGVDADDVVRALASKGVVVCSLAAETGRYAFEHRGLPTLIRASLHYYNTPAEVERLVRTVAGIARSA